jgi:hypothetical protein
VPTLTKAAAKTSKLILQNIDYKIITLQHHCATEFFRGHGRTASRAFFKNERGNSKVAKIRGFFQKLRKTGGFPSSAHERNIQDPKTGGKIWISIIPPLL